MTEAHSPVSSGGLTDCPPILCVESAARSIDYYYVNCLQFPPGWRGRRAQQRFLEPGEAADVGLRSWFVDGCRSCCLSNRRGRQKCGCTWMSTPGRVSMRMYREWAAAGAYIDEPPQLRPWGMYEMRVRDPDGHVLRISSSPPLIRLGANQSESMSYRFRSLRCGLRQTRGVQRGSSPKVLQRWALCPHFAVPIESLHIDLKVAVTIGGEGEGLAVRGPAGVTQRDRRLAVRRRRPVPSGAMRAISRSPQRFVAKAIQRPSGDHAGCASMPGRWSDVSSPRQRRQPHTAPGCRLAWS